MTKKINSTPTAHTTRGVDEVSVAAIRDNLVPSGTRRAILNFLIELRRAAAYMHLHCIHSNHGLMRRLVEWTVVGSMIAWSFGHVGDSLRVGLGGQSAVHWLGGVLLLVGVHGGMVQRRSRSRGRFFS